MLKKIVTLLSVLCVTLVNAQYLNPNGFPLITNPVISYKTVDHNSEGFLVTLDSTVFHFFRQDSSIYGNHIGNTGRIVMRTSNDNGDTWTNPITIFNSPYDDRNIHGGITEDGRIIVTFRKFDAPTTTHIEYCFMYSDDKGQTWDGPFTVATEGVSSGTNQIFGNNNIGYYNCILSSKYCELRHSWDGSNWDSIVYIWDYRLTNQYKISEASFAYLGYGVIIGLFRNESNIFGENYYQVESYDYGKTWTEPTLTNIANGLFCPSPWIFYEPVYNDIWVIAIDRRGNFPNYSHEHDSIWLYKVSPDEILGNPRDYYPFLVFPRPNPSFYRTYGYPASTKTPDGNYLVIFTESEFRNPKSEWAYLYQFKILYHNSPVSTIAYNNISSSIKVFPNPASTEIFIPIDGSYDNQIFVFNDIGQTIMQFDAKKETGSKFYHINVESLMPGLYNCVIVSPTEKKVATFIKQ